MASVSHLAAGALCGAIYARKSSTEPAVAVAGFAALALSPDLDLLMAGWAYTFPPVAHRVLTHALPAALVAGAMLGLLLGGRRRFAAAGATSTAALASHGMLDAMTTNGPGPQLLWPFVAEPIQLPWQPIPGTQFYQDYFTAAAVPVVAMEALVSVPLVVLTAVILARTPHRTAHAPTTGGGAGESPGGERLESSRSDQLRS